MSEDNTALLATVFLALTLYVLSRRRKSLNSIPTVGPSVPFLSYIGTLRFLFDAGWLLQEGYGRFRPGIFKIATLNRWIVVVCGTKFIEELRKAPDTDISSEEAVNDVLQISYTLGKEVASDPYHVHVLSTQLTRNLHAILPEIRDEMSLAIQDYIPSTAEQGWVTVPALETMAQIITRVTNRAFVGAPLCHDNEYVSLCRTFAMREMLRVAIFTNIFPKAIRTLSCRFMTRVSSHVNKLRAILQPIIAERRGKVANLGKDYPRRPNDLLQWLLTDSRGSQATDKELASRILAANAAAIHETSTVLTQALYHLVAHPQYMETMREEVEYLVRTEGWTKSSIDQMHLVDSFIKETMRISGMRLLTMMRKTTRPFTFSNGIIVPGGTMIYAASDPVHLDPAIYPNADQFNGFRFERLMDQDTLYFDNDGGSRHQLVATSADFLGWGHGKHACPGRFFAAVQLKMILGYLIMNYDLDFEQPGVRPPDLVFEAHRFTDEKGKILFKRRERS
ncbi:hypothetical protein AX14_010551 [Amanita brunnescens Koide BX004]|nr:hypothetical protein AX14_010551 [Amanita brunnescens Koide BX004]